MNYTKAHELFKNHGIIFTLQIDPSVLPFGHVAHFASNGTLGDELSVISVPPQVQELRSATTHIHPDALTNEIWQTLKKPGVFLTVLQFKAPTTIVQVQEDDTLLVSTIGAQN